MEEAAALRLRMGAFLRVGPWKVKVVVEIGQALGQGTGREGLDPRLTAARSPACQPFPSSHAAFSPPHTVRPLRAKSGFTSSEPRAHSESSVDLIE